METSGTAKTIPGQRLAWEPPVTGALRTWIGTGVDPWPIYTPLDRCPECRSLVLTSDIPEHAAAR